MAAINRDPEVARFLNRPTDERAVDALLGIVTKHWASTASASTPSRHVHVARRLLTAACDRARAIFAVEDDHGFTEDGRRRSLGARSLRAALTERIYVRCHLGLDEAPGPAGTRDILEMCDGVWLARLRAANPARSYWEPGWRVTGAWTAGELVIERDGVRLCAAAERVRPSEDPASVEVLLPAERLWAAPGFYLTHVDAGPLPAGQAVRIYAAPLPAKALDAFAAMMATLQRTGIAATCKIVNHPAAVARPDALVAYVEPQAAQHVASALVKDGLPSLLADPVPGFSQRVAPGLALTPPHDDERESFGQFCAGRVADVLLAQAGRHAVAVA